MNEETIEEKCAVSDEVTAATSAIYQAEMRKLDAVADFEYDCSVHGKSNDKQMMYKLPPTLISRDGLRGYEFLVEFDKYTPCVGIYYGVKGLIYGGGNRIQKKIFDAEWLCVRYEICQILNNVFPNKDFTSRFLPTDNADADTYWPFWIRLNEDEDIIDVAVRSVRIIREVYQRFIDGETFEKRQLNISKAMTLTYFTNCSYYKLMTGLPSDEARCCFTQFIANAEKMGLLIRDGRYEKAWRINGLKDVEVAFLLASLWERMVSQKDSRPRIPWNKFFVVFLDANGEKYNDNLKKQYQNPTAPGTDGAVTASSRMTRQREATDLLDSIMERNI